jgi:hypothetical protein
MTRANGELATTVRTVEQTRTMPLAAHDCRPEATAMNAEDAIGPAGLLDPHAGSVLVMEFGVGQIDVRSGCPSQWQHYEALSPLCRVSN